MNDMQHGILLSRELRKREALSLADPEVYTRAECINGHSDIYKPGVFEWGSTFCDACAHSMHPIETFRLDDVPEDSDPPMKRRRKTR